jgi:membrane protein DedA with SNARE-associated domain
MFEWMEAWLQTIPDPWAYLFLFASSFIENIFPPLPGDTFVVLGAFLVARHHLHFLPAYASTLAGSILGFMAFYAAGRRWGRTWLERGRRGAAMHERLETVDRWFGRYGSWVLVFNRFLAGFRSVVSFASGVARMDGRRVFVLALISCAAWNAILMALGLLIGDHWETVIANFQRVVFTAILVGIAAWWVRSRWKKSRAGNVSNRGA